MNGATAVLPVSKQKSKTKKASKTKESALFITRKTLIKLGVGFLVLIIFLGTGIGYLRAYDGKIYPKVVVAGVKVGGLTVDEAKNAVGKKAQELNEKGPEITYNDRTLTPKLDEMGVFFNVEEAVQAAYQYGRAGNIFQKIKENALLLGRQNTIEITPQIDEQKFNDYLGQLAQVAEKEPINAGLAIHQGVISLTSSEGGRGLDKVKLKDDLKNFINSGQNGKISMVTSDLEPAVKEDGTAEARAQAEKYMQAAPISVTFDPPAGEAGTNNWPADRSEIGSWIKFAVRDHKLVASIDASGFVNWVANQVEIPAKDREIEDGTGTVLNEGQDGRGADTKTLLAQIKDALNRGQPNTSFALAVFAIPRGEKTIYPHAEPGRYSGRYIDINLSEQTLYAFEGTNQVNSFLVSTGRSGYATPTGEFHIYGKDRYTLMDGPDYYLPNVPFVSWFLGDYSIHGTYWHHNFGHVMSHGCVNASTGDAEWLFGWADIGTPVYIHY